MSLLPLSRPIDRVWLRAGFEKRVPNPAKKGRENMCRIFVYHNPGSGQVDICAGPVYRALD
jgi:hypothetical protein